MSFTHRNGFAVYFTWGPMGTKPRFYIVELVLAIIHRGFAFSIKGSAGLTKLYLLD